MSNEADQLPIAALLPAEVPQEVAAPGDDQAEPERRAEVRKAAQGAGKPRQHKVADSEKVDASPDLVDRIITYLSKVRPDLKEDLREVEQELRAEFGGGDHYLRAVSPTDKAAPKIAQVLSAFNGRNPTEVARELGISRATVYRRLRAAGGRR